jgi:hypothetical protein
MTRMEVLSDDIIAFLMRAVVDGRLPREVACTLVAPWVEGDAPSTPVAEDGAQLLHGFDITLDESGRQVHGAARSEADFLLTPSDMRDRATAWLSRLA